MGELKALLATLPDDMPVLLADVGDHQYGSVNFYVSKVEQLAPRNKFGRGGEFCEFYEGSTMPSSTVVDALVVDPR